MEQTMPTTSRSGGPLWELAWLAKLLALGLPEPPLPWQPWMPRFLAVLVETGNVSEAIRNVPRSRKMVYEYRRRCPRFRGEWDTALEAHEKEKQ